MFKIHCWSAITTVLLACMCTAAPVQADLSVSLTISGGIDEIIEVLEQIRGIGEGGEETAAEPLRLRIHSVAEEGGTTEPESEPPPAETAEEAPAGEPAPAPEPPVRLENPLVTPDEALQGATVLVTVRVADEEHTIDTVAAQVPDAGLTVDLYDSGISGDRMPGDGIWSGNLHLPADMAPGNYSVAIFAFDPYGTRIMQGEGGAAAPVSARAGFTVTAAPQ